MRIKCTSCNKTKSDDLFPMNDTLGVCLHCIKKEKEKDKIHFVYKITNTINGMFYIGKHSTYNIDDNYMGSGGALKVAIMLYGIDNFTREILHYADTSHEAFILEEQYVNVDTLDNPKCMNNQTGGQYHHKITPSRRNKYFRIIEQYVRERDNNILNG